jgi:hypothetical protein
MPNPRKHHPRETLSSEASPQFAFFRLGFHLDFWTQDSVQKVDPQQ